MSNAAVVVPCFNEAERLNRHQFLTFARRWQSVRFLMVNDGSRDATGEILAELHEQLPHRIQSIDLERNSGKAEAVRQGLLSALEGRPDYVGFWDADLATPLEAIIEFIDVLDRRDDVDVVIGSRMPLLGRRVRRDRVRRVLSRAFASVCSVMLGERIYDTQCGAKLFRVTPAVRCAFEDGFVANWTFDVEVLARLKRLWEEEDLNELHERVFEYPVDRWNEIAGSKVTAGSFLTAALEVWSIYWRYLGPRRVSMPLPEAEAVTTLPIDRAA